MVFSASVNSSLFSFLQFLVLTYFSKNNFCTVIYYDHNMKNSQDGCNSFCEYLSLVERVFTSEQLAVVWIASGNRQEAKHLEDAVELGCQSYITFAENITSFLEMKLMIKDRSKQRIRDHNFLIFSEHKPSLSDDWVTREAFKFYPNLWFMTPTTDHQLKFYTQNFTSLYNLNLYHVNSFNLTDSTFTTNTSLFYDKLVNLGGRSITVGVLDFVPYCKIKQVGAGKGNADAYDSKASKGLIIDGMDGRVLVEFCRHRNCQLMLRNHGANDWGEIFRNGSGYGMIYSTYAKETDFTACAVSYSWVSDFLDGSAPIGLSSIGLLIPRAKLLPTFLTPKYPFSPNLWIFICVTLAAIIVVHHIITTLNEIFNRSKRTSIGRSSLDIVSIYLEQGISLKSRSTSSYRVFISFILLSGLILSNSYAGGLASVLTTPQYEASLETIADFASSPYLWAAPARAAVMSIEEADSVDVQAVVKKFLVVEDLDQLYQRTLRGDLALAVELVSSGRINIGPYIREDNVHLFEVLDELLYADYTQGVAQRGWPMMEYFNKFVLETVQHGLTQHWERLALRSSQSHRLAGALEGIFAAKKPVDELKPLTVQHVLGALIMLGFEVVGAVGVFVGEVLWKFVYVRLSLIK